MTDTQDDKQPDALAKFVEDHCQGEQYDSCVESPCPFASHSGCRHPLHPKNADN